MNRSSLLLTAATALSLLILLQSSTGTAQAQTQGVPTVNAFVQVHPALAYDFLGSGPTQVVFQLTGTGLSFNQPVNVSVTSTLKGTANYMTGSQALPTPILPMQNGFFFTYSFTIPSNAGSFQFYLEGSETTTGFLWRSLFQIPYFQIAGISYDNFVTQIVVPLGNVISQEYSGSGGTLPAFYASAPGNESGSQVLTIQQGVRIVVIQSTLFLPVSIAVTSASLVIVAMASLNLFGQGRQVLDQVKQLIRDLKSALRVDKLSRVRPGFSPRALFQPRKLLALFLLCALLTVAIAAMGGPDPRMKAYVVADSSNVTPIRQALASVTGNAQIITPAQDFTDFAVMSSVGQFQLVVVSNYAGADRVGSYILAGLGNVPVIVVDNTDAVHSFPGQVNSLYQDRVVHVKNAANLTGTELHDIALQLSLSARTNSLGLHLSSGGFRVLLAGEALLSFLLVFLGWAYLGSLASETSTGSDLSHLLALIGAGIFVFVCTEAIYVAVSSLLAFPLSLHAVSSGAHDVTAVGVLGLGGGSTPRLLVGVVGVFVGAASSARLRIKATDMAILFGLGLFLVANPFTLGTYVYQTMLLFLPLQNFPFGDAYTNLLSVKGFLYGVGSALGGGITPTYLLSAGKILFFAGIAPLAYLRKLSPSTATLGILFAALLIGDGGVRVGEMTPDKTVAALVPGLVAGLAFAVFLFGLSFIEARVRGNWKSQV